MNDWINVKDRLPDTEKPCLIFMSPYIGIDRITNPKDGNLWSCADKSHITHWMPLPNPPKGEE